jgi:hypothetical protein
MLPFKQFCTATTIDDGACMSDAQNDKRRGPRQRVLKGGIVAFNDRRSTLPCIVRDISETGARLRMETMSVLAPDTFLLIIELDGIEAECQVVRRNTSAPSMMIGERAAAFISHDGIGANELVRREAHDGRSSMRMSEAIR